MLRQKRVPATYMITNSVFLLEMMKKERLELQVLQLVQKKTVFTPEQLEKMLFKSGKLNVIIFRLITYLKHPITLNKIKNIRSFKNKIQTITLLAENDYMQLKNLGYFDGRYIIN